VVTYKLGKPEEEVAKIIVMICVVISILVVLVSYFFYKAYAHHQTFSYCKTTEAEIKKTTLEFFRTHRTLYSPGPSFGHVPVISFKYTIDGKTYISHKLDCSGKKTSFRRLSGAEALLEDFPVGKKVTAYYLPEKPADAFIIRKLYFGYMRKALFMSMLTCGLVSFCFALQKSVLKRQRYYVLKQMGTCLAWFFIGIISYGYYFSYAERPFSVGLIIRCIFYFLTGLAWTLVFLKPVVFGTKDEKQNLLSVLRRQNK